MPESGPGTNQLNMLNALTFNQKISLVVLAVAVVAGVGTLVYFMNQSEYQVLYKDLGSEEASTVVARLKSQKVAYELTDGGRSIRVPAERIDELRIQLASEGLPQGKIGFEIFDRNNLGMTEFAENVAYKRALEGELARTILGLKEIGEARVHLVLPKETLFQDKSEMTKASVIVKLKSGKQLSDNFVSGIVHLVSSAVEGLEPSNVTVVDSNGRMLSGMQGSAEESLTGTQVALKAQTEKELTAKVVNILEPIVGQGRVKADASVVMDFSRREKTEQKFDPMIVMRSQSKKSESSEPTLNANAGVPGTQSNDQSPAPNFIPLPKTSNSMMNSVEQTNYEVSNLVQKTVEPVGQLQKVSVAVIVDDAVKMENGADGNPVRKTTPRTPEDLKKLTDLVSAAVGIDVMRGDVLTIENIAFDVPSDLEGTPASSILPDWRTLIRPALRYGAFLLLFVMVYLFLVRPVTKRILAPINATVTAGGAGGSGGALAAAPGSMALGASLSPAAPRTLKELEAALGETAEAIVPGLDAQKADVLKLRIADFVQRDPEKGAQLLRSWLIQDGNR